MLDQQMADERAGDSTTDHDDIARYVLLQQRIFRRRRTDRLPKRDAGTKLGLVHNCSSPLILPVATQRIQVEIGDRIRQRQIDEPIPAADSIQLILGIIVENTAGIQR